MEIKSGDKLQFCVNWVGYEGGLLRGCWHKTSAANCHDRAI